MTTTTTTTAPRINKLVDFKIDLNADKNDDSTATTSDPSSLAAAQGAFQMYCIDEADARIVVGEVFEDALNGYFGKGGLTLPQPNDNGNRECLIIDAGANIGAFSVFIHRALRGKCRVYAFEPIPETFGTLSKNFEHHRIKGRASNLGLGKLGCPDTLSFTYYPQRPACSTYRPQDKERANIEPLLNNPKAFKGLYKDAAPELVAELEACDDEAVAQEKVKQFVEEQWRSETLTVPMKTLQDCLTEHGLLGQTIDFLKVDVEGAELDVLLGLTDDTWQHVQQVAVEVHDFDGRLDAIQALFRKQGFSHVVAHGIQVYNEEYGMNHHFVYAGRRATAASSSS
mmetsp:Transcript_4738/g.13245  ORF Transcript_4738/g.13245 Transcript_4738/m.13245 type:complete len:341 (+) Transcript_4738:268-1290(+)